MNDITMLGIDLAKNVFQLHGVTCDGRVVVRRHVGGDEEPRDSGDERRFFKPRQEPTVTSAPVRPPPQAAPMAVESRSCLARRRG